MVTIVLGPSRVGLARGLHFPQSVLSVYRATEFARRHDPFAQRRLLTESSSTVRSENSKQSVSTEEKHVPRSYQLSAEQEHFLDRAMRVNQAGELAATLIYKAQTPVVVKAHPNLRLLMKHMYDQEAGHFKTFNELLAHHRVRPSALYPVWQAAATVLGWSTGLMGREAAMACTEAVETEIGEHYNDQVRELLRWEQQARDQGEEISPELASLTENLRRIRDEELEHLDHAVEHDAKAAQPYEVLTNVIRGGCRAAIWISQRI